MKLETFLELLDEPQVQEKIKALLIDAPSAERVDIVALQQENQALNLENKTLKEDVKDMTGMIERLKNLISGKDKEISTGHSETTELNQQLSALTEKMQDKEEALERLKAENKETRLQLNEADKKLNWYREQFSDDVNVQNIYSDLSAATQGSLSGIFKSTTVSGLIACGIQEKNIGNLWEYAKNEVVNASNPDTPRIIQLFELLFSRFIIAFPMYQVQRVTLGEDFDTQLHIKHNSSDNVSGAVTAVLLRGYLNTKTEKIIKQSIVKI
ncbi:MAG: hypothetical protein GQ582_13165 [Methyloprofundus sp.]|nr:hypothetical protein [Methyloprofundus sp.]